MLDGTSRILPCNSLGRNVKDVQQVADVLRQCCSLRSLALTGCGLLVLCAWARGCKQPGASERLSLCMKVNSSKSFGASQAA